MAADVHKNLARISQLTDSAHGLRKIITSPELEYGYNKYKEQAVILRNDVNNQVHRLQLFDENWTQYKTSQEKISTWMNKSKGRMSDIESDVNMRKFWVEILIIHHNSL